VRVSPRKEFSAMSLSKRSNGIYYLWYFDDSGKRHKVSTGCRVKSDALKFVQQFKKDEHNRKSRIHKTSLLQFKDAFLAHSHSVHSPATQSLIALTFSQFMRVIGDLPLHQIGVREIESFLSTKQQESSAWTARKYYSVLASAFETALRWNYIASNPFKRVAKPKVVETLPVYFSKDDFKKFIMKIQNTDHRELYLCAVFTGMRLGELTSLQWSDVDFVRNAILVQNKTGFSTKTRRNRVVPMNPSLRDVLGTRRKRVLSDLVFPFKGRKLTKDEASKTFKKYVLSAGVDSRLHFHSLRHTFATWLVQESVPIFEVQKLLGHTTVAVTQRYAHLAPSELHSAVDRLTVNLN
jgi:integrase